MLKSREIEWRIWKIGLLIPIVIATILLSGCSTFAGQGVATENTAYLTPIPKETLQAYQWDTPVRNKIDAVIHARLSLDTTRLSFTEEPKVVMAEEMSCDAARKHIVQPGVIRTYEERSEDAEVWLVLFEGDWLITGGPPPEHPVTSGPPSPSHGCVYVIIDQNGSCQGDFGTGEIGTTECSP